MLILSNPLRPIFSKPRRRPAIPLRIQIDHGFHGLARIKNIRVIRVIRVQKIPRHSNTRLSLLAGTRRRTTELSHRPNDMSRPKTKRQIRKRKPVGSSEIVGRRDPIPLDGPCPRLKSPHPFPARMAMEIVWDALRQAEEERTV